jgi:ribosomal protein S18 acetylase RimI-like enzyme
MGAVDTRLHWSPGSDRARNFFQTAAVQSRHEIRAARFPDDLQTVRMLFREYATRIGIDLAFQGFEEELAGLPGKYQAPAGRLVIAWDGSDANGCVALRPLNDRDCEMKRLYVHPRARGAALGRALALRICAEARAAGYGRICLDTLSTMTSALALYASLGFRDIAPYVFNPIPGARFLALDLEAGPPAT